MTRRQTILRNRIILLLAAAAAVLFLAVIAAAVISSLPASATASSDVSGSETQSFDISVVLPSDISYPDESEIVDPELPSSEPQSSAEQSVSKPSVVKPVYRFNPKHAIIYEPSHDYVHYSVGADTAIAPASTAKLMTALTALEILSPDTVVTVGAERRLLPYDASVAGLSVGDRLTVRELVTAMLVYSGGDAAYTLAVAAAKAADPEFSSGASAKSLVSRFEELVNARAAELGCTDCHFVTPDGYDAAGQKVTARSLARITAAALTDSTVMSAVSATSFTIHYTTHGTSKTLYNTNKLLRSTSSYYSEYAFGVKTGTTDDAGYCLVGGVVIGDRIFIIITMNAKNDEFRYRDLLTMIDMAKTLPSPPESSVPPESSLSEDSGVSDASGATDTSVPDSSVNTEPVDTSVPDSSVNTEPVDTSVTDSSVSTEPVDTSVTDSSVNTEPVDTSVPDSSVNTEPVDTSVPDSSAPSDFSSDAAASD